MFIFKHLKLFALTSALITPTFDFNEVTKDIENIILKFKEEKSIPGLSVGIVKDGNYVFLKGYGFSDIENLIPMNHNTATRIASISKPISMALLAKLIENARVSLDELIHVYVKDYPKSITLRQLVSHKGGIRHYDKNCHEVKKFLNLDKSNLVDSKESNQKSAKDSEKKAIETVEEFDEKEYYIMDRYKSVRDAIKLFQDDPLCAKPGTTFLYSTHGYTLISAVIEAVTGSPFTTSLRQFFTLVGMDSTYIDEHDSIIPNRSKYYVRNKKTAFVLKNAPYVDNSYKWAGGGLLSNVPDLLRFGQLMFDSYRQCYDDNSSNPQTGYLSCQTMKQLWRPVVHTNSKSRLSQFYGMGWFIYDPTDRESLENIKPLRPLKKENESATNNEAKDIIQQELNECPTCLGNRVTMFHHSGGAVGATSVLAILTLKNKESSDILRNIAETTNVNEKKLSLKQKFTNSLQTPSSGSNITANDNTKYVDNNNNHPNKCGGVIVVILTNLQEVPGLTKLAYDLGRRYL